MTSSLLAGGCETHITDSDIQPINLTTLRKVMEDRSENKWVLLDARSTAEFEAERLPGAVHRPLDTFTGRKGDIDPAIAKFALITVYGNNPGSAPAKAVAKRMLASGYEEVYMYFGGLEEWRRSGLATEGTESARPAGAARGAGKDLPSK